jgi:amidase/aspartyl-tRNA(Asn)/glutamyl-tRNA(Gln) amidotransferase subunit A
MSATYVDVVGPMARTVKDAAYLLDAIAGPSDEDPRTGPARGHLPPGGYVQQLTDRALEGRRFGLVGEGWRTSFLPLDPDTRGLYEEAIHALEAQGAQVVEDPFLGSGFIELYQERRQARGGGVDEMAAYLQGLGEGAAFHSIEEWEALTGRSYRDRGNRRGGDRPDRTADRDPEEAPNRAVEPGPLTFPEWRTRIQGLFREVLDQHDLDGLFFPQAGAPIPDLIEDPDRPDYNPNNHPELPSNIINALGLPVVTLPFAYYADGSPFVLAFIGDLWSEVHLLAWAYDLEQATGARVPPALRPPPEG